MKSNLFYLAPISFGLIVVVTGIIDAWGIIRAKRRLKKTLAESIDSDPSVKLLAQHAKSGFDKSDYDQASVIISESLKRLPQSDQRFIERGLHQGNVPGERRFVADLFTLL